VWGVQRRP